MAGPLLSTTELYPSSAISAPTSSQTRFATCFGILFVLFVRVLFAIYSYTTARQSRQPRLPIRHRDPLHPSYQRHFATMSKPSSSTVRERAPSPSPPPLSAGFIRRAAAYGAPVRRGSHRARPPPPLQGLGISQPSGKAGESGAVRYPSLPKGTRNEQEDEDEEEDKENDESKSSTTSWDRLLAEAARPDTPSHHSDSDDPDDESFSEDSEESEETVGSDGSDNPSSSGGLLGGDDWEVYQARKGRESRVHASRVTVPKVLFVCWTILIISWVVLWVHDPCNLGDDKTIGCAGGEGEPTGVTPRRRFTPTVRQFVTTAVMGLDETLVEYCVCTRT